MRQETRSGKCGVRYASRERKVKESRDTRCKTKDERCESRKLGEGSQKGERREAETRDMRARLKRRVMEETNMSSFDDYY